MTTQDLQTLARTINEVRILISSDTHQVLDALSTRLGDNCVPPVELDQFLASCGYRDRQPARN
jgi:hypothetical protein